MMIDPNDFSFRKYKAYADIRVGSSGSGCQTTVRLSTTAIFGDFGGYFSETLEKRRTILYDDNSPLPACN